MHCWNDPIRGTSPLILHHGGPIQDHPETPRTWKIFYNESKTHHERTKRMPKVTARKPNWKKVQRSIQNKIQYKNTTVRIQLTERLAPLCVTGAPLKPLENQCTMVPKGLRGILSIGPPLCRRAWASRTAEVRDKWNCFSFLRYQRAVMYEEFEGALRCLPSPYDAERRQSLGQLYAWSL